MTNEDLYQLVGGVAADVASIRSAQQKQALTLVGIQRTQEQQSESFDELREQVDHLQSAEEDRANGAIAEERRRSLFWWKFAVSALIALLVPTLSIVWQGGRLTEKIEQLSERVDQVTVDREARIRAIEHH